MKKVKLFMLAMLCLPFSGNAQSTPYPLITSNTDIFSLEGYSILWWDFTELNWTNALGWSGPFASTPNSDDIVYVGEDSEALTLNITSDQSCKRLIIVGEGNNSGNESGSVTINITGGATLHVTEGIWLNTTKSNVSLNIESGCKLITPNLTVNGDSAFDNININGIVEYESNTGVISNNDHHILGTTYNDLIIRGEEGVRWNFTDDAYVDRDLTIRGKNSDEEKCAYTIPSGDSLTVKGNWYDYRKKVSPTPNVGKVAFSGSSLQQILSYANASGDSKFVDFETLCLYNDVQMDQRIRVWKEMHVGKDVKYYQNTKEAITLVGDWTDDGGEHVLMGNHNHKGIQFGNAYTQTIKGKPRFQRVLIFKNNVNNSKIVIDNGAVVTIRRSLDAITHNGRRVHIVNNGELIFEGTENRTAYLYPIRETSRFQYEGSGTVSFQHYLDDKNAGWFYMGSTVQNMPLSNWGETFTLKTNSPSSINTFDEEAYGNDPDNYSLPWWKNLDNVDATSSQAGKAYRTYIWNQGQKPKGLDANGDLVYADKSAPGVFFNYGNVEVAISNSRPGADDSNDNYGWNFIANPYPAALDFDKFLNSSNEHGNLNKDLINSSFYVYSQRTQGYFVYMGSGGSNLGSVSTFPTDSSNPEYQNNPSHIAPGQGFFVHKTNPGNGFLTFHESDKPIWAETNINEEENYHPIQFRTQTKALRDYSEQLAIGLKSDKEDIADYTVIRFADQTSTRMETDTDFSKFFGYKLNLFSWAKNDQNKDVELSINTLPFPTKDSVIQLGADIQTGKGKYVLTFQQKKPLRNYRKLVLYDKVLKRIQDILTNPTYSFEVTPQNYMEGRFELRLSTEKHLADVELNTPVRLEALEDSTVVIPVYARDFKNINSASLAVNFNPNYFNELELEEGELTNLTLDKGTNQISWKGEDVISLGEDKKLFSIKLRTRHKNAEQLITFTEGKTEGKDEQNNSLKGNIIAPPLVVEISPTSRISAELHHQTSNDIFQWEISIGDTQKQTRKSNLNIAYKAGQNASLTLNTTASRASPPTVMDLVLWKKYEPKAESVSEKDKLQHLTADVYQDGKIDANDYAFLADRILRKSSDVSLYKKEINKILPWEKPHSINFSPEADTDDQLTFYATEPGRLSSFETHKPDTIENKNLVSIGEPFIANHKVCAPLIYQEAEESIGMQFSFYGDASDLVLNSGVSTRCSVLKKNVEGKDIFNVIAMPTAGSTIHTGDTVAVLQYHSATERAHKLTFNPDEGIIGEYVSTAYESKRFGKSIGTVPSDPLAKKPFLLYPIPLDKELHLQLTESNTEDVSFKLFNTQGQVVFNSSLKGSETMYTSWDLSFLGTGEYTYQIVINGKKYSGILLKETR